MPTMGHAKFFMLTTLCSKGYCSFSLGSGAGQPSGVPTNTLQVATLDYLGAALTGNQLATVAGDGSWQDDGADPGSGLCPL